MNKPKRLKISRSLKKGSKVCESFVKNRDEFGKPVTLNYKGSDTYQTISGAILTIFNKVWSYTLIFIKIWWISI